MIDVPPVWAVRAALAYFCAPKRRRSAAGRQP